MKFIDTNIFIRYLTGDDAGKERATQTLFQLMDEGREDGMTSESAVAEVIFVLTSRNHYGLTRADAAARVRSLLTVRGLYLEHRNVIERAIEIYETFSRLDFEDALSVAHMEDRGIDQIVSYDRGFDAVPTLTRVEP